jgi:hypothetical protein
VGGLWGGLQAESKTHDSALDTKLTVERTRALDAEAVVQANVEAEAKERASKVTTYTHTHAHARTRTYTHAHAHARNNTHAYMHRRTHTHCVVFYVQNPNTYLRNAGPTLTTGPTHSLENKTGIFVECMCVYV